MADHCPYPVIVERIADVGGMKITCAKTVQIRCGCVDTLEHDYGHEQETP